MQIEEKITITITGINHDGEGVGRSDGAVIFVPGTVPGERVLVQVKELRKNYARGLPLEIVGPSEHRENPACSLAGQCGGCSLQHISYREQLRLKTEMVRQNIIRIGGASGNAVKDIIGMEYPWHYRNKVRLKVRTHHGKVTLGFFEQESHRLVAGAVDSGGDPCRLAHVELNQLAKTIHGLLEESHADVALPEEITLRRGNTGQMMVVLSGDAEVFRDFNTLARSVITISGVESVDAFIATGKGSSGRYRNLAGTGYIEDRIGGLRFIISVASFYQVNPEQTAVLYRLAMDYCELQGREEVADAYCGVGTITLYLARHANRVRGYEIVPGAVRDAEANVGLNGIKNAAFYKGAVERLLPEHVAKGYRPGVIVLDQPRSGCRPEVLKAAAQSGAQRLVYVSCNPSTLARDIARLDKLGYRLQEVQPVDMFPHTAHVEAIILLQRQKP